MNKFKIIIKNTPRLGKSNRSIEFNKVSNSQSYMRKVLENELKLFVVNGNNNKHYPLRIKHLNNKLVLQSKYKIPNVSEYIDIYMPIIRDNIKIRNGVIHSYDPPVKPPIPPAKPKEDSSSDNPLRKRIGIREYNKRNKKRLGLRSNMVRSRNG